MAARKEVVATIPYNAIVLGFHCQGVIDGRANLSVDMTTDQGEATFVIYSQGTAQTYVRGVRGPIVALGPAWGPFTSRTLVRFDGRKFTVVETTPWAQVHGELERVEGRHGGRVGRAVGRLLLPVGRLLVPRAEAASHADWRVLPQDLRGRTGRKDCHEAEPHHPCGTIAESALSRDQGLGFSDCPRIPNSSRRPMGHGVLEVPVLPENPGQLKDVRLELWVRSTTKEAQALAKLTKQPLAKQLVQQIPRSDPSRAGRLDGKAVRRLGWSVACD